MKVLIIDDTEVVREGVAALLRAYGHMVLEAHDGRQGLEIASDNRDLGLIITDYNMQEYDGLEVLLNLKEMGHEAKRWLFTGELTTDMKRKATELGAEETLDKTKIGEALKRHGYNIRKTVAA